MATKDPRYQNPYGNWNVTTEGDVEGRSTKQLGTFKGYVDDIAFALSNQCFYSLKFSLVPELEEIKQVAPSQKEVSIQFDIESGTWDMKPEERVKFFQNVFSNRNGVYVSIGHSYASATISNDKIKTQQELQHAALIEAKKHLTPEQIKLIQSIK